MHVALNTHRHKYDHVIYAIHVYTTSLPLFSLLNSVFMLALSLPCVAALLSSMSTVMEAHW